MLVSMRLLALLATCATLLLTGLAVGPAGAAPAVLYVPTEDVTLTPYFTGSCGSQDNSAFGCTNVDAEEVVPAYADAAALRDAFAITLLAYDVHLAEERPPEYLAYTLLVPSDTPEPRSQSFTCSGGGINCGARKRNDVVRVFGPTQGCPILDVQLASIYAFGRSAGQEGVENPLDAMNFVPDFATGTGVFVDGCAPIVPQLAYDDAGELVELPLECAGVDHEGCPDDQQNSHADLLAVYGPRTIDGAPPLLANLSPGDGAMHSRFDELMVDVDISDADPVVGGRWTIYSPVLESAGVENGVLTICTNDVCDAGWDDAAPHKATDSDWSFTFTGLPVGTYEITFEASDFHGNVAAPVLMVVEVVDEDIGDESSGWDSGGWDSGDWDSGDFTTGATTAPPATSSVSVGSGPDDAGADVGTASNDGSSGPEADDGLVDHGCICTASGHGRGGAMAWVLLVAAAARRRAGSPRRRC
jgi:hypothetical protein